MLIYPQILHSLLGLDCLFTTGISENMEEADESMHIIYL